MTISIDPGSGFCFGVVYAIQEAERELEEDGELYCLGDIVHNNKEVERLAAMGLKVITHEELKSIKGKKVLIRAHGEPPETYSIALKNDLQLIDASCPVVLRLQKRIRCGSEEIASKSGQVIIYGKRGHAEVIGLDGQIEDTAIIISAPEELENNKRIDYSRPIRLYSQTTQNTRTFREIQTRIREKMQAARPGEEIDLVSFDSICRQVSNRAPLLEKFASDHSIIIFVSGKKSSNGQFLYNVCSKANERTYFISDAGELRKEWFLSDDKVGVCGATSTPRWLMEEVAVKIASY